VRRKGRRRTIAADMVEGCSTVVDRAVAVKAIREVCRYFGGQLIYIPVHKTTGKTAEELHGVLRDAAGDPAADLMLEKLMALYGGYQIYIPKEEKAFHHLIIREIYEKYDGVTTRIGDLCREYNIAFNTVYAFYHEYRDEKLQNQFDFSEN
jgi:Mor family transcriptional regulator